MIPVEQSRIGSNGRCFNACLASILEMPEKDVPDFADSPHDPQWLANAARWLETQGLYYVQVQPNEETIVTMFRTSRTPIYHTMEGISPRGGMHAVVGDRGRMVFDPHPNDGSGHGLVQLECYGLLCARFA